MGAPYENTISGLLKRRRDLLAATEQHRQALALGLDDIRALDRTLRGLGYKGALDRMTPSSTRVVMFQRDELRRYLLDEMRKTTQPVDISALTQLAMRKVGIADADRDTRNRMAKRVTQCLRLLRSRGVIEKTYGPLGYFVWSLVTRP